MTGHPPPPTDRLFALLDAACQDALESPLADVMTWPRGDETSDLYQDISAEVVALRERADEADELARLAYEAYEGEKRLEAELVAALGREAKLREERETACSWAAELAGQKQNALSAIRGLLELEDLLARGLEPNSDWRANIVTGARAALAGADTPPPTLTEPEGPNPAQAATVGESGSVSVDTRKLCTDAKRAEYWKGSAEHYGGKVGAVQNTLSGWRKDPEKTIRKIAKIVGYYIADTPPPPDTPAPSGAPDQQPSGAGEEPATGERWYFTFGSGHAHTGHYVVIEGNCDEARDQMLERFGSEWGFQYDEAQWFRHGVSQAEKCGLVELPASRSDADVAPLSGREDKTP